MKETVKNKVKKPNPAPDKTSSKKAAKKISKNKGNKKIEKSKTPETKYQGAKKIKIKASNKKATLK
ncbi:MAG: hypothetical protein AAB926_00010 [Patescibacteria group bacterium]